MTNAETKAVTSNLVWSDVPKHERWFLEWTRKVARGDYFGRSSAFWQRNEGAHSESTRGVEVCTFRFYSRNYYGLPCGRL